MIKNILVPLDGSNLAECVLSYVEELAAKLGADKVSLVSVTERVTGFRAIEDPVSPSEQRLAPEARGKLERAAMRYLDRVGRGLEGKGIKVESEVLFGNPAVEISIYARHAGVDLIIMSSHGKGGPSRWARGSVADKVLKSVELPVMIIRAPACSGTE